MEIYVTIKGDKETARKLNSLGRKLKDWGNAFRETRAYLIDYYSTAPFASQGGVYGERWPRLNPKYVLS